MGTLPCKQRFLSGIAFYSIGGFVCAAVIEVYIAKNNTDFILNGQVSSSTDSSKIHLIHCERKRKAVKRSEVFLRQRSPFEIAMIPQLTDRVRRRKKRKLIQE